MFSFQNRPLEQAAEFHFYIRNQIHQSLKQTEFSPEIVRLLGKPYKTHYEFWVSQFGDRFLDMTTIVRIAMAVENELRTTYMRLKNYKNLNDLNADQDYNTGIFQRIMPWHKDKNSAFFIFNMNEVNINDAKNIEEAQEVLLHRHLFAHNMGIVDKKYIDNWARLKNEDITPLLQPHGFPSEDCYWFRPLENITRYIETVQHFVRDLQAI